MKKVTVYIPCYNYGRYVKEAVESVLKQTMYDWELIIIDDGSTDETMKVLEAYKDRENIRIITQQNSGLNVTNNIALRLSSGEYIVRLDADDYLDENAFLVMSNVLDRNSDIGLVHADYYHVDPDGHIIEIVRRKKIGQEVHVLDLPAHGACTMFRKDVLLQIGGYAEEFSCQDGYEIWLKFINRHKPYNVNIPLFYYRQHAANITKDHDKILETRRKIKERFVEKYHNNCNMDVLGVIPVVRKNIYSGDDPFRNLAGKPLIWYTLNAAVNSNKLNRVLISSDDGEILDYAGQFSNIICHKRKAEFAKQTSPADELIVDILSYLKEKDDYQPDAVCILYTNFPLRQPKHIDKAINTMIIFDVDSVISVEEELSMCYHHRRFGLTPLSMPPKGLKVERDALFMDKGSVTISKTHVFKEGRILGEKIGHITMLPEESIRIRTEFDRWLAEKIITEWSEKDKDVKHEISKRGRNNICLPEKL